MTTHDVSNMISERVHLTEPDAKVVLFGSRARGEARPDSDWDVMVLLADDSKAGRWDVHEQLWDLGLEVDAEINPVVYRQTEWEKKSFTPFYKNVMHDGIVL
jgi:predicted nucleotidyltransferase